MSEPVPKLVVRTYVPWRGRWLIVVLALLGVFAIYVTYEYGRFDGGYDRLMTSQRAAEYRVNLGRLEKANRDMRVQLAEYESTAVGQGRERAEVARTIGELQAQVAQQAQEIAFYKGIVEQGGNAPEVKIQQLRVTAGEAPRQFRLSLTLVQSVRSDRAVDGTVKIRVEGERDGGPLTLALAALTADKRGELPFSFRYFENIDPEITLPEGFSPARVQVEVRSARKGVSPVTQTLLWSVE